MVSRSKYTVLIGVPKGHLGANLYVCRDTELVLRLTKANIFSKGDSFIHQCVSLL